jgi:glycosyltransferase involved in cell wall biosynthesis
MNFTVAICTWNRSRLLEGTLARLAELDIAGLEWELIVVNNACTDDTDEVLRRAADRLPLRVLHEPAIGVSNARNRAIAAARGDLLAWTDDDVLVEPTWLRAYQTAAGRWVQASFFGGPIVPLFESEPPGWITDNWPLVSNAYGERALGPTPFPFDRRLVPYAGNLVFRTSALRRYRFDPSLGPSGPVPTRGEETTLVRHLLRDGHTGYWVPDAGVRHVIPSDRLTLKYLGSYFIGQGRAQHVIESQTQPAGHGPWAWQHAMDLEREYIAARLIGDARLWLPKFIAARMARGRCAAAEST